MLICVTVIGDALGGYARLEKLSYLLRYTESRVRSNHTYISVKKNGRSDCMEPAACTRDGISGINTVSGIFAGSTFESTTSRTIPRSRFLNGGKHIGRCLHACSKRIDHFDISRRNALGQNKLMHPETMKRLAGTNNPRTIPVQDPGILVSGGLFGGIITDGGGTTGCCG